jgi:hypothetical protein
MDVSEPADYLTPRQAARRLGMEPRSFERLIREGRGPPGGLYGSDWRYRTDQVDQ